VSIATDAWHVTVAEGVWPPAPESEVYLEGVGGPIVEAFGYRSIATPGPAPAVEWHFISSGSPNQKAAERPSSGGRNPSTSISDWLPPTL